MLAGTPPQSLAIVEKQDARGVNSPMSISKPKSKLSKSRKAVVTEAPATLPIDPLPQSAFSIGDRVHHGTFGDGTVTSIREDKLTISFGSTTKEIREDFVTAMR